MSFSFILRGRSNHLVLSSRAVPARPGPEGADRASARRVRKVHVAQRLRHPAHEVNQSPIVLRMLPKCESMWARRMRVTSSSTLTGGIPANTMPVLASSTSDRRRTAAAATAAARWWSAIVSDLRAAGELPGMLGVPLVENLPGKVGQGLAGRDGLDDPGRRLIAAGDVVRGHGDRPLLGGRRLLPVGRGQ